MYGFPHRGGRGTVYDSYMEKELGIAPTATNDTIADLWAQMERAEDVAVFSALCEEAVRVGIVKG